LERQRLDKWLWHARVVKARTSVRVLKVTGFCERRGDAASARVLYEDLQNDKPNDKA
jgi:ribosome-associated heat shock protein Hsp15